jgi:phosphonoacetate hydrolase
VNNPSFMSNFRGYAIPSRPIVVVCLDGCSDEYLNAALLRDRMPNLKRLLQSGYRGCARGVLPSFTNVNNASLVTGVPPNLHGLSGNYFFDQESGQETMMNSGKWLRCSSILADASQAGVKVAIVTAKEKLRDILSTGWTGIAFSSEKASSTILEGVENIETLARMPVPATIYSAEASLFVMQAGVGLVRERLADLIYLSLTDYIQHFHAPDDPVSLDFLQSIDRALGELDQLGAVVGATADHGMNAKHDTEGNPNIIYLEPLLDTTFGPGNRVILPITDPYVRHHGALGSYATVYLHNPAHRLEAVDLLLKLSGVDAVFTREQAALKLEAPPDRIGDLVVLANRNVVLGRTPAHHDLSQLKAPLRSHGGRHEEMVPFLISKPLSSSYQAKAKGDLRNFDIFDFALNGLA